MICSFDLFFAFLSIFIKLQTKQKKEKILLGFSELEVWNHSVYRVSLFSFVLVL